jgi:hypothetical protein
MWKEQPIMTAALPEQRLFLAILTSVAGLAVCWLTTTPFGLLAPIGTLYLYAEGRAVCCFAALAIAFIGTAIAAYSYADARHDLSPSWVAFFAVALCVGEEAGGHRAAGERAAASAAYRGSARADLEHHARWNAILRQQTIHGRYRCHS